MESNNVPANKPSTGKNKSVRKGGDKGQKDDKSNNSWMGARPILGGLAIVALMAFEYWFISNGFRSACPADKICDPKRVGWGWPISILVPMAGVMAFFGVLLISNIFSKSSNLSNGEMRKAITGGIVVTYIFFIMTILFSSASPIYRLPAPAEASLVAEATGTPEAEVSLSATATMQSGASLYVVHQEATPTLGSIMIATDTPIPTPTATVTAMVSETATFLPEPSADTGDTMTQEATIQTPIQLAASVIKAFTILVGVVVGFYFSTRSLDNYNKLQALLKKPELKNVLDDED